MDNFNFKNLQLAYGAVYDQNLCESMEELGLIGDGNSEQDQFELWVNELLDEGYDLSDYTWDELGELYEGRGRWSSDMKRNRSAISSALSGNVWSTHPASRTSSDIKPKQSSRPQSNYRGNLSKTDRAELAVTARKERKAGENFDPEYTPSRKKVQKAIKNLPLTTKNSKKLRKQAAMGEEFELWVNELLDEGYDLSDYTWDELYENYQELDEVSMGLKRRAAAASADKASAADQAARSARDAMSPSTPYWQKMSNRATAQHKRLVKAAYPSKRKRVTESYDAYDLVLEYLLDEGYADTLESAEAIMVNMSEEWIEGILVEKTGYGKNFNQDTDADSFRPGVSVPPPVRNRGRFFSPSGSGRGTRGASDTLDVLNKMGEPSTPRKKPVDKSIKRLPR